MAQLQWHKQIYISFFSVRSRSSVAWTLPTHSDEGIFSIFSLLIRVLIFASYLGVS